MAIPTSYRDPATIAAVEAETTRTSGDYRALVCLFLLGGNDSHNMIIPRAGSANRIHYDLQRGTLAITAGTELPLTAEWGINPNMPNTKAIYDAGKLGVLMNVGVLAKPTTRAQFKAQSVTLPVQLFAHNSQQALWQALPYLAQTPKNGYMGRADDLVGEFFNFSSVADVNGMFSISSRPLQMQGFDARSNDVNTSGPTTATVSTTQAPAGYLTAARTRQSWNNKRQALFASAVKGSVVKQAAISANLAPLSGAVAATFTGLSTANSNLGAQLSVVARLLQNRASFGHRRDMFYVTITGWDDHDGLAANYGPRLAQLDAALGAFWTALGQLGLRENVTLYSQSDFGRALKQNNDGTDHGWGGNSLIMGGAVQGGQLFGTAPDFATGSVTDADQGRQIPTTSADQYVATMLKWWGVPESKLEEVLPNLVNFPVKTLPIMREPVSLIVQPKAFDVDLVASMTETGDLPASISYSRVSTGPFSQFDRDGNLVCAPTNIIANSAFTDAEPRVGIVVNSGGWGSWNPVQQASLAGLAMKITEVGVEDGMRYTEWEIKGTTTATTYPQIGFSPTFSAPASIVTAAGESWTMFVKMRRVAEKSTHPIIWAANLWGGTAAGAQVAGHQVSGTTLDVDAYKPMLIRSALNVTDATCVRVQPRVVNGAVVAGTVVNETVRVYEPMLLPGIWETPPPYVATTGTPIKRPRLDFNPKNGSVRGVMRESPRRNYIRNSIMAGQVPGIPGTLPTNMAIVNPIAGITIAVGQRKMVNGISLLTLRVFGKATASGQVSVRFDADSPVVAGASESWVLSAYARLAAGSFAGFSIVALENLGTASGNYTENGLGSLMGLTGERLVAQRVYSPKQFLNATTNQVWPRVTFVPTVGQYVDLTIEIGAPQLEKGESVTSYIPTGGQSLSRPNEYMEVLGANFTPWFNPAQGTVITKCEFGTNTGAAVSTWPRAFSFTVIGGAGGDIISNYGIVGPVPGLAGRSGGGISIGGVSSADNSVTTPIVANEKAAVRALSYGPNYIQTSHRGALSGVATPATFPAVNGLEIGGNGGRFQTGSSWIHSLTYYSTKLTPEEMAAVTAS